MLTYDLLAWQERQEKDERTIGDLFYIMGEAMPDLSLTDVLVWFIKLLNQLVESEPVAPIKQLNETVDKFISSLPQSIASQLQKARKKINLMQWYPTYIKRIGDFYALFCFQVSVTFWKVSQSLRYKWFYMQLRNSF